MSPQPQPKSSVALHSMFEGLFNRALHVEGALKEQLRAAGFDLDRPEARYPVEVWERCVDLACAHRFPGVPRGEAWRRMGRIFIEGYFNTLVGKIIATALPFLGPKSFVDKSPRFITTGLEGADVWLEWHDVRNVTLHIHGAGDESGNLMAGVMEVCFERMKAAKPTFEASSAPGASSLRIGLVF